MKIPILIDKDGKAVYMDEPKIRRIMITAECRMGMSTVCAKRMNCYMHWREKDKWKKENSGL